MIETGLGIALLHHKKRDIVGTCGPENHLMIWGASTVPHPLSHMSGDAANISFLISLKMYSEHPGWLPPPSQNGSYPNGSSCTTEMI